LVIDFDSYRDQPPLLWNADVSTGSTSGMSEIRTFRPDRYWDEITVMSETRTFRQAQPPL